MENSSRGHSVNVGSVCKNYQLQLLSPRSYSLTQLDYRNLPRLASAVHAKHAERFLTVASVMLLQQSAYNPLDLCFSSCVSVFFFLPVPVNFLEPSHMRQGSSWTFICCSQERSKQKRNFRTEPPVLPEMNPELGVVALSQAPTHCLTWSCVNRDSWCSFQAFVFSISSDWLVMLVPRAD